MSISQKVQVWLKGLELDGRLVVFCFLRVIRAALTGKERGGKRFMSRMRMVVGKWVYWLLNTDQPLVAIPLTALEIVALGIYVIVATLISLIRDLLWRRQTVAV